MLSICGGGRNSFATDHGGGRTARLRSPSTLGGATTILVALSLTIAFAAALGAAGEAAPGASRVACSLGSKTEQYAAVKEMMQMDKEFGFDYYIRTDPNAGLKAFEQTLARQRTPAGRGYGHLAMASALRLLGRLDEASRALSRARAELEAGSDRISVQLALFAEAEEARIDFARGQRNVAVDRLLTLMTENPDWVFARAMVAQLREFADCTDMAADALRQMTEQVPGTFAERAALRQMVSCLVQLGRESEAREVFERLSSRYPEDRIAIRATLPEFFEAAESASERANQNLWARRAAAVARRALRLIINGDMFDMRMLLAREWAQEFTNDRLLTMGPPMVPPTLRDLDVDSVNDETRLLGEDRAVVRFQLPTQPADFKDEQMALVKEHGEWRLASLMGSVPLWWIVEEDRTVLEAPAKVAREYMEAAAAGDERRMLGLLAGKAGGEVLERCRTAVADWQLKRVMSVGAPFALALAAENLAEDVRVELIAICIGGTHDDFRLVAVSVKLVKEDGEWKVVP